MVKQSKDAKNTKDNNKSAKTKKVQSSSALNEKMPEKDLFQEENRELAQDVQSEIKTLNNIKDLDGKFLLVNVGTESHPASLENIKDIERSLTALLENNSINCVVYVTHHAVNIRVIS